MLNHPGPYHFGPKVVITQIFQYFPLRPFQRDIGFRIHLIACMYIHCWETSLINKINIFLQNAEPPRPLQLRPEKL